MCFRPGSPGIVVVIAYLKLSILIVLINCSRSESARALVALAWSCLMAESLLKSGNANSEQMKRIVDLQAMLFYGTQASGHKSIASGAVKKLRRIWTQVSIFLIYLCDISHYCYKFDN